MTYHAPSPRWVRRHVRAALARALRAAGPFLVRASVLALGLAPWTLDLRLAATPPTPNGLTLTVDAPPAGYSNFNFYWWVQPPLLGNWIGAGFGTNATLRITNPIPNALYGVTALGQSNLLWRTMDIGIAGWEPDIRATNRLLRITAPGGIRVATGQWINVSLDLKTWTQQLRFHNPTQGVIIVEHKVSTNTPGLFMAYPAPLPTPPLPQ
jgi:hypothetical protein